MEVFSKKKMDSFVPFLDFLCQRLFTVSQFLIFAKNWLGKGNNKDWTSHNADNHNITFAPILSLLHFIRGCLLSFNLYTYIYIYIILDGIWMYLVRIRSILIAWKYLLFRHKLEGGNRPLKQNSDKIRLNWKKSHQY